MAIVRTHTEYARQERIVVTYLITSTRFCTKLFEQFEDISQYFQSVHTKKISAWCEEYFGKYQKSPKVAIQELFQAEKENMDGKIASLIEEFLNSISEEFEREDVKMNSSYVYDIAQSYFRLMDLVRLRNILSEKIMKSEVVEGETAVANFISYEERKKEQDWENPFTKKAIVSTFEAREEDALLIFPGALGHIIGKLERGQLVAIRGRAGVGKTYWMIEFALHACSQGYNVVFANLELTSRQFKERLYSYLTGEIIADEGEFQKEVFIPVVDCLYNQDGTCRKDVRTNDLPLRNNGKTPEIYDDGPKGYKTCFACRGTKDFNPRTWFKKIKRNAISARGFLQRYDDLMETRMFSGNLRMITYPSGRVTVERFDSDISLLERTGFVPDLIVSDYADKFQMSAKDNPAQQIAHIWEVHKAIAVGKHVMVVTGSQVNKQGEWKGAMAKEEIIDVGLHLEQTDREKKIGIMNMRVEKHRSKAFLKSSKIKILHSFEIGRPYLDSFASTSFPEDDDKKKK